MSNHDNDSGARAELRSRAVKQLRGAGTTEGTRTGALAALGVLHEMASSPSSAADALALMHELQVHQVELDLQEDELRKSRAEVEAALARSVQLYEGAPVGLLTVERNTALVELNRAATHLLGGGPPALLGRSLDSFFTSKGSDALHALLAQVTEGHVAPACTLELVVRGTAPRRVHATASVDPAGPRFLVAILDLG